jgi:hypothetical protein
MNQPLQNPPVDRLYMRSVVGRQAPPERNGGGRNGSKGPKGKASPPGGDYVIGLTTFHVRPRGRG